MVMTYNDLKDLLDTESHRINRQSFIAEDPVQFPRRFSDKRDIEIAALLASTIAWGKRSMICRNADRLLSLMDNQPYEYVMERGYEDLPDCNIHRTFFARNLRHYLRGLHQIYTRYGSLEDFAAKALAGVEDHHSWHLADALNRCLAEANDGNSDSRCLPLGLDKSALKRFNMALRWLVRDDGIVDLGIWTVIKPSQLYVPLDVHVGNISRQLGLLMRKANDRQAVDELTEALRRFNPQDPVIYDYALFGLGVSGRGGELAEMANDL